jgi:hypothetical protein
MFPNSLLLIRFIAASADHFFSKLPSYSSSDCSRKHFPIAPSTFSSHVKWIPFLTTANSQKPDGAKTALGKVRDGLKSDVLYRHWSGSICVGCAVVTLKKHQLIFPTRARFFVSTYLGSSHKSPNWFSSYDHLRQVNGSFAVPENCEDAYSCTRLGLEYFLLGSSRVSLSK